MNKIFSRNFTVQERVDDTFKVLKEKQVRITYPAKVQK